MIVSLRQWAFPLVILVVGSGRSFATGPLAVAVLAVFVAVKIAAWRRFTYRIDSDSLRIESGIFNRQRREVPLRRIQQVDLQRKLRHRVLGVAVVRIDTAGGTSGAEAVLEALADDEAMALREALLLRSQAQGADVFAAAAEAPAVTDDPTGAAPASGTAAGPSDATEQQSRGAPAGRPPEVVAQLTTRQLAVAGVTGARLLAVLPLAGAAFGLFIELPGALADSAADQVGDQLSSMVTLIALALLAIPVVLGIATATSVLTDHEFTLVRSGTDLHLRRGLLDQREATLSLQRIQVVRIYDNPLRRRLGLVSVQLQSAGSGASADGSVSRLTIPYVASDELHALLDHVLPGATPLPELIPAPPAARRRAWVRRVGPVVLVALAWAALTRSPWALLLLLASIPAGYLADLAYRGLGHAATGSFVFARRGGLVRELVAVPIAKTQSSLLSSSPFQRRVDLGTLQLGVAGRGRSPAIIDGEVDRLLTLRHDALYAQAARADEQAVRRRTRGERDDEIQLEPA